jgi:hypothetical protein
VQISVEEAQTAQLDCEGQEHLKIYQIIRASKGVVHALAQLLVPSSGVFIDSALACVPCWSRNIFA